jgi:hypothetical protein
MAVGSVKVKILGWKTSHEVSDVSLKTGPHLHVGIAAVC